MRKFASAQELVAPGETALFLFTDGRFFEQDGTTGSSGFWVLDPTREVQRVVIFRWTPRDGQRYVELFSASPAGIDGPETEGTFRGRYTVRLRDIQLAGTTEASWEDFVSSDEHPVTYVRRENVA